MSQAEGFAVISLDTKKFVSSEELCDLYTHSRLGAPKTAKQRYKKVMKLIKRERERESYLKLSGLVTPTVF